MLVGGWAAFDLDLTDSVYDAAPQAIAFVVLATYVVLFLLLGSVLLPIKAVVVNFLSISASYGALVWVFQEGHLSGPLDFTPGPINTTTPIIMFCILFGLSMDYEVMLLSRIKEEYEKTGTTAPPWLSVSSVPAVSSRAPPSSWPRSSSPSVLRRRSSSKP